MPTRSFAIEEEGKKRFWDVTWDGGDVEISSGAWGTSGRARAQSFSSPGERDAFIAGEVRKIVKKGYVEVHELAPVGDAPTAAIDTRVRAWTKRLEALAQPAWLPVFGAGAEGPGRVRGPVTLLAHEAWPECPSCRRPLSALLELDCSRLPSRALKQKALMQLFCCEAWSSDESTSARCIFDGWLVRLHPPAGVLRSGPWGRGQSTSIVAWTEIQELPPELDDTLKERLENEDDEVVSALLRSVGAESDEAIGPWPVWAKASGKAARNDHKLGGWPTFVQECTVPFARQLFQLECTDPFDVNLGDIGAGHVLLTSSGEVRFFWASH